jgi:hypothetical protein
MEQAEMEQAAAEQVIQHRLSLGFAKMELEVTIKPSEKGENLNRNVPSSLPSKMDCG